MAHTDDIDELVSSVRDFVSHKEPPRTRSRILLDRLILTPDQRVPDDEVTKTPVNTVSAPALPPVQSYDKAGLEATIAELEAAVTAQFDDWEADEGEDFGKAAWAASAFPTSPVDSALQAEVQPAFVHTAQTVDADAQHQTRDKAASSSSTQANAAPVDADAVAASVVDGIDDQALRSLVAEIVHDELGGELGERITRNVRKMVRREINRVLTSREMGQG